MKYYTLYPLLFFAGLFTGIYRHEILDWFLMLLVRFKIADYSDQMPDIPKSTCFYKTHGWDTCACWECIPRHTRMNVKDVEGEDDFNTPEIWTIKTIRL